MTMPERAELPTYETLLTEAIRSLTVDSGTVTSSAAVGTNVLHDATKNWAANVHKNRLVKIIRGAGAGQTAVIESNTAKSLVIKQSWAEVLDTTSVYVILGIDIAQVLREVLNAGYDISATHPLEVHDPKVGSLISYEGTTTADGAGDGSSFIDSVLATKPDYDGNLVIITSGDYAGQARDINGVTTGGIVTPASAFGGQIVSGVTFAIIGIRTVPAEVAALMADVGDASASTLGSLYAILGNPAQTFLAMIGYQGATSLANKLTAARALLLDEITAGRMSELDAGNLPADIDTLLTRLSAVRAGYLDNLSAGAVALEATLTAIKGAGWTNETLKAIKDAIDAIPTTAERGTDNALLAADYTAPDNAGIATLLSRVTAAVALASVCTEARLSELDAANIPTDLATITGYVDTLETSLGAFTAAQNLKAILGDLSTTKNLGGILGALTTTDNLKAILGAYTAASNLKAAIDAITAYVDCLPATLGDLVTKNLAEILSDSTAFAGADIATIKAYVDCLPATLGDLVTKNLAHILSDSVAFKGGDIPLIKTQTDKIAGKMLFSMDFWSDSQEEVAVTSTAGNKGLPSVVIADLPDTATIVRAVAMFKFRMVENIHATEPNNLVLDQYIQVKKSGQSYTNAIKMINTGFTIAAATREGGDVVIGNIDLAAVNQVDANATYECQWTSADAAQNNLQFNDVQMGIRIWYSI